MTHSLHGQGLVLAASLIVTALVLELVRRRKIGERFSLIWLLVAGLMILAATLAFPLLFRLAPLLGIVDSLTALFLIAFGAIGLLCLYFTVVLTRLSQQNRVLAQRVALLEVERMGGEQPR